MLAVDTGSVFVWLRSSSSTQARQMTVDDWSGAITVAGLVPSIGDIGKTLEGTNFIEININFVSGFSFS